MKKKRFSEEQIIGVLKEVERGMTARDVIRKHNISEQTFYRCCTTHGETSTEGWTSTKPNDCESSSARTPS